MARSNVCFFINICRRTSLEDIEDEEEIEEYDSEDNTDIEKKVLKVHYTEEVFRAPIDKVPLD